MRRLVLMAVVYIACIRGHENVLFEVYGDALESKATMRKNLGKKERMTKGRAIANIALLEADGYECNQVPWR